MIRRYLLAVCLLMVMQSDGMYIVSSSDQFPTYDLHCAGSITKAGHSIEPYQAERDFSAVAKIIKEYAKFLIHHQQLELLLERLQQTSVTSMSVYRVDGVTVGFVNIILLERSFLWYRERYVRLAGIGVATAYQGLGYGNVLLDYAIAVSRKLQAATLELEVHRDNSALAWYQSKGFVVESYASDGWISCTLKLKKARYLAWLFCSV